MPNFQTKDCHFLTFHLIRIAKLPVVLPLFLPFFVSYFLVKAQATFTILFISVINYFSKA